MAAVVAIAATGIALLPLALSQGAENEGVAASLAYFTATLPINFALGAYTGLPLLAAVPPIACGALIAVALLWRRGTPGEQRAALKLAALGLVIIAIALALVLAGSESLSGAGTLRARNVVLALVPFLVAVSLGLAGSRAGRLGLAGLAAVCVASIGIAGVATLVPEFQRPDWRGVVRALPASEPTLAVQGSAGHNRPIAHYTHGRARDPEQGDRVTVIAVIRRVPVPGPVEPPSGFRLAGSRRAGYFEITKLRSDQPRPVDPGSFDGRANWPDDPISVFVEGR